MMSEAKNDGGPAFPQNDLSGYGMGPVEAGNNGGMSLRDWFAGQFLVGASMEDGALDVSPAADETDIDAALRDYWSRVAHTAYIAADAMLAARASLSKAGE